MGNDVYTTGFDPFNPTGTSGGTSFYTYNNDKVNPQKDELVKVNMDEECVEFIYKHISNIIYRSMSGRAPNPVIYKDIYVPKKNKLVFNGRVYGEYIPPKNWSYEFDE